MAFLRLCSFLWVLERWTTETAASEAVAEAAEAAEAVVVVMMNGSLVEV